MSRYKLVSNFENRNKDQYEITRDKWGKFYVYLNSTVIQRKLNAEEIVRYLSNGLNGH